MTRRTLQARGIVTNGAPRHHHAVCTRGCGWHGTRAADTAELVNHGKRCPTCGAGVRAARS